MLTSYSVLNSDSMVLSLLTSQDSSNAVSSGSLDERAMSDDEVSALYAFILDCECLRESVSLEVTHSSHPHRMSWGVGRVAPRSSRIFMISQLFMCAARMRGVMSGVKFEAERSTASQLCKVTFFFLETELIGLWGDWAWKKIESYAALLAGLFFF